MSRETALAAYASVLLCAAITLVVVLVTLGYGLSGPSQSFWPLLGFVAVALVVEKESVWLTKSVQISVAFLPLVFVAVVFGPLAAAVVGALTMVPELLQRDAPGAYSGSRRVRWAIWMSTRILIGGLAGLAAHQGLVHSDAPAGRIVLATAAAAIVNFSLDMAIGGGTLALRGRGSIRDLAKATAPVAVAGILVYTAVVACLAYAYLQVTPWSAVLFFIPALAAHRLFVLYREQRDTSDELAEANQRLERANMSFAAALVATLDARDRYTAGHSAAVAVYARDIAERLGLSEDETQLAHLCGLVHDIGKIGLPAGLLEKPGPLTSEERTQMEQHSAIGERILAKVEDYADVARIVRHHHEWINGSGYPDGLEEDEIPLLARVIAVADAYNAMTSDRPYRDAMPSSVARSRLAQAAAIQFDSEVVAAFEAVLTRSTEAYRAGAFRFDVESAYELAPVETAPVEADRVDLGAKAMASARDRTPSFSKI